MAIEREQPCPVCGETRTFYRAATTTMHLGTKTKWRCSECNYSVVEFERGDETVSTA